MNYSKWLAKNTSSLSGRTVAVTGTTGGLGRELCSFLAGLGAALILVDRNPERSEAHANDLRARYPGAAVETLTCDLEDIGSVKSACAALRERPLDYLIHNAGAYSIPRKKCSTGLDNVFQIDFASPYYMTMELLPLLRERGGRVIAVGSIAHDYSESDPDDVDFSTRERASRVYGNAKRYLMFSLYELFAGETDATLSVVHPGITFTGITAHYPKAIFALIKHPMKVIFMRPKKAALSLLSGAYESCGYHEWIGPRFFNVWGLPRKKRLHTATAEESARIFGSAQRLYEEVK